MRNELYLIIILFKNDYMRHIMCVYHFNQYDGQISFEQHVHFSKIPFHDIWKIMRRFTENSPEERATLIIHTHELLIYTISFC
jgi:hypothetical protein